jgi:hypothetical protein
MYLLYKFPPEFQLLTSLTHPRKILMVMLQIGKAKDILAPLRICIRDLSFRFEFRPRHRPSLTEIFCGFLQSFQVNAVEVHRLGHGRFFPNPFKFIAHVSHSSYII